MIANHHTLAVVVVALAVLASSSHRVYAQGNTSIERLTPPKAAPPPGSNDRRQDADTDLEQKREQRRLRDKSLQPAPTPYSLALRKELEKETTIPRDKALMFETSLVAGTVMTRGDRERYTAEPTTHFNISYRYDAKARAGKAGPWFGFRLAPFTGSGFHKKRPGSYGLTYFGPMIGLGKIDLVLPGESRSAGTQTISEPKIPVTDGWSLSTGIAAVSRSGRQNEGAEDSSNDFSTKGVAFDGPGLWLEARWLRILYDSFGYNVIAGIQTGKDKEFIYVGMGAAGWN